MNRIVSVVLLCISVLFLPCATRAQEPEKAIETFIAMLKSGKSAQAIDQIYGSNPWMAKSADAVTNVRTQLTSLHKLVGELKNHEKLQEINLGTRFKYVSYLAAYERQPVRFVFEFYKPEDTWMLFGFSLDDKLDDDVEARAKATVGNQ